MRIIPRGPRTAALAALALVAAGCSDKDSNPAASGTGATQEDIQASAISTMDFVNEIVTEIEPLAEARFEDVTLAFFLSDTSSAGVSPALAHGFEVALRGPARNQEIVWNEAEGAWILDVEQTETDQTGEVHVDVYFRVQYLDGAGTPQYQPDATTATMSLVTDFLFDILAQEDGQVLDMDFDYSLALTVGGLPDGPYGVEGDGAAAISMLWTGLGEDDIDFDVAMDWAADVDVPADGSCPAGVVTVNVQATGATPVSFTGTYDGTPSYDWTLWEGGSAVATGSEPLDCGAPPAL